MPTSDPSTLEPLLVPRPRHLTLGGGSALISPQLRSDLERLRAAVLIGDPPPPVSTITIQPRRARSEHRQSHSLKITPDAAGSARLHITADVPRGLRLALATLDQLLRQYPAALPLLEIHDHPAFQTRGVMLDISRNKIPTNEEFERIVDQLAALKFNHLQLYTEHTFAYADHEEVWRDYSPVTAEEVRRLDAYAAARGVELAANQNTFGHLREWLKHPRYAHLAEIEPEGVWKFMHWERKGPFSLCPTNPRSIQFVRGLLDELLPNFSSPLVNIGCDETFDVGFGRSGAEVGRRATAMFEGDESRARASLYFEFVNQINAAVARHKKRPMFWADIAMSHPDMLCLLDRNMIGLAWGYEPDAKFREEAQHLAACGMTAWVCPGTSSWRSITGRTTESRANIAAAAACADMANVEGFLICDWGDMGHMQQWPIALRRIADGAQAGWSGALNDDTRPVSLHVLGDETLEAAAWIDRLGDADLHIRQNAHANYSPDPASRGVRNASAIFNDVFPPAPSPPGLRAIEAPLGDWVFARRNLDSLSKPPSVDDLMNQELAHTLNFANWAAMHAIFHRGGCADLEQVRPVLAAGARYLLQRHRDLWLKRNRPGGLRESCAHLKFVIAALERGAPAPAPAKGHA